MQGANIKKGETRKLKILDLNYLWCDLNPFKETTRKDFILTSKVKNNYSGR